MSKDVPVYSDFWLDPVAYDDFVSSVVDGKPTEDSLFAIDLIRLASVRRIVSNYVDILTGENIPVYFKAAGDSFNVGGKEIYITAAIHKRKDFDNAVGLALHEAAHTVLSDFELIKTIWANVPKHIWDFCDKNSIRRTTMERFIKSMVNIIEDWYIDDWVITQVPGYLGYYESSYNVLFNTPVIDQLLISNEYRFPSLNSYEFRIINFTNPLTDLQALPGLDEIACKISIGTISRLPTTRERIRVAYEVIEIVLRHIQDFHDRFNPQSGGSGGQKTKGRINRDDFFGGKNKKSQDASKDKSEGDQSKGDQPLKDKEGDEDGGDSGNKSDSDRTVEDVANTLGQRPKPLDDENKEMTAQVNKNKDKELPKHIQKEVDQQVQCVHGETKKEELAPDQKRMLDLIEQHGITLVYVPLALEGNETATKVGCIVVKKLTMELIESGKAIFPMACSFTDMEGKKQPTNEMAEAVGKGVLLGSRLGKRLLIRRESNPVKNIRKRRGKINRRYLWEAGCDEDDFFHTLKIVRFNKANLHITVDASNSMSGEKWYRTITMCVAICKATSMIDNVHVTVSFRGTTDTKGMMMPYVLLAYDSKVDKFSKVRNLFRFLNPSGATPEGLAFGATMDLFTEVVPDEEERYFLNISDGEPWFQIRSSRTGTLVHYGDGNGVEHTKYQVDKIRRLGIQIMAYYVQDGNQGNQWLVEDLEDNKHNTKKNFQRMYGKDARFIKPDNIVELAHTMNELFLRGS